MRNKTVVLIFILAVAGLLRFWQLGQVPPSPDWDEAALGYNAYSIMKTGRDEYGQFLPLILRSFDDYKPAIYVYFVIPAIKIFGLNTFAVRFPAALLGTLAVFLTYFLIKELFFGSKKAANFALIGSFLLAISPWHLQFSRIAFESNLGLFFDILIVILVLKAFKKPWLLILAAFFAGLNIYVYQAEKVFTPLLVLTVVLIWRQKLLKLPRKYLLGAIIVGLILTLPFAYLTLTTPEIFLRARGTSITADQTPFLAQTVERLTRDHQAKDYLGLVLDNRRVTYFFALVNGYLSHFDLNWLFLAGDEARHHAPGMGLLYLWELPFLLLGIYGLLLGQAPKKAKLLIFAWFLLAPIPASFTTGVPHAVRTIRMMPALQIFIAYGLLEFWKVIGSQKRTFKYSIFVLVFTFFIFNLAYYLNQYFIQQNYFNSKDWQYGYQEAIEEVKMIENDFQKIIVSNQPHLDQSYMFFLFYSRYDPILYQSAGGTVSGGYAEEKNAFGKYVFRPIDWSKEEKSKEILYVGRPDDFPGNLPISVVKTINFLNGESAIKIVKGG